MSDMKCPFCGRELSEYDHFDRLLVCFNPQCEAVFTKKDFLGNKNLWQELIRTRKALDVAVDALNTFARIPQPIAEVAKVKLYAIKALEQKEE